MVLGGAAIGVALGLVACGEGTQEPTVDSTPPGRTSPATTPPPPVTGPQETSSPPTATGLTATPGTRTGDTATDTGDTATGDTVTDGTGTGDPGESAPPAGLEDFLAPGDRSQQDPTGAVNLVVEDVRVGPQEQFDRVVFDLSGSGTVGWRVEYTDEPAQDGSGAPVDLAGDHVLAVHLQGIGLPEPGSTAYDPGELLVPGTDLRVVTEVLRLAPFEGQLNAFIGTRAEQPFRVFRLSGPERLVVDVALP